MSSLRIAAQPICCAVAQSITPLNDDRCTSTAYMASTRAVSSAEVTWNTSSQSHTKAIARVKAEKLSITPSAKDASRDRYAPYRCRDMTEVAERLVRHLDETSGG